MECHIHVMCTRLFPFVISLCMCFPYRIDYHLGNQLMPIFEKRDRYSEYATSYLVDIIAGQKSVDPGHVCTVVPIRVQSNVSFVVDMDAIKNPLDLRADDNGAWLHNGIRTIWLSVSKRGDVEILSRKGRPKMSISGGAKLYCMRRTYHALKSSPDFKRMIVTMEG